MGSKFKVKRRTEAPVEKKPQSKLSAKRRMVFLLIWGAFSVGLYLASSKYLAMTPVIVTEILLFLGLCLYFLLGIMLKKESEKDNDTERISALLDKQKLVLIFIIPLIFIILYDFIVSMINMPR